ncbi:hypothetical protein FB567DRAFT_579137 [Paraphoma chrysanthemicola]|uniref:Uncharacterized protein n=1 Tax=Paraphoma chrysanthemicola TaxID=798071 RepID=A0A8K0R8Y9_9PLEO|nr:hypothetical protein FB567DRAFT_579137 [Paraphoma chrysanthemicola]
MSRYTPSAPPPHPIPNPTLPTHTPPPNNQTEYPFPIFIPSPHPSPTTIQTLLSLPRPPKLRKVCLVGYIASPIQGDVAVQWAGWGFGEWDVEEEVAGVVVDVWDEGEEFVVRGMVGGKSEVQGRRGRWTEAERDILDSRMAEARVRNKTRRTLSVCFISLAEALASHGLGQDERDSRIANAGLDLEPPSTGTTTKKRPTLWKRLTSKPIIPTKGSLLDGSRQNDEATKDGSHETGTGPRRPPLLHILTAPASSRPSTSEPSSADVEAETGVELEDGVEFMGLEDALALPPPPPPPPSPAPRGSVWRTTSSLLCE